MPFFKSHLTLTGNIPVTKKALVKFKPDIAVMASGSATLDFGGPILMQMKELIEFIRKASWKVIANHLEALNHCPTSRLALKKSLEKNDLLKKSYNSK